MAEEIESDLEKLEAERAGLSNPAMTTPVPPATS